MILKTLVFCPNVQVVGANRIYPNWYFEVNQISYGDFVFGEEFIK